MTEINILNKGISHH